MKERKTRKLVCIVTGRALLATKDYFDKKVEKLGSEEEVLKTYICKEAKDLLKKGYTVEKIRELLNVDTKSLKEVSQDIIDDVVNANKKYVKRLSNFTNTSNILNVKTDPDVKNFIKNILDDDR
tara:strand:- start:339 stop:710 length:372 start_codon:yes stop_codon:yes gene_type:complete